MDDKVVSKCMKESKVADVMTFKKILESEDSNEPHEKCLRKCVLVFMGFLHESGEVNVRFQMTSTNIFFTKIFLQLPAVKKVFTQNKQELPDAAVEKCRTAAAPLKGKPCDFGNVGLECYIGKMKFKF